MHLKEKKKKQQKQTTTTHSLSYGKGRVERYCCNAICGAPTTSEGKGLRWDEVKPLSDCHDISGDMRRYKASYNSAYMTMDVHES